MRARKGFLGFSDKCTASFEESTAILPFDRRCMGDGIAIFVFFAATCVPAHDLRHLKWTFRRGV